MPSWLFQLPNGIFLLFFGCLYNTQGPFSSSKLPVTEILCASCMLICAYLPAQPFENIWHCNFSGMSHLYWRISACSAKILGLNILTYAISNLFGVWKQYGGQVLRWGEEVAGGVLWVSELLGAVLFNLLKFIINKSCAKPHFIL